MSELLPPDLAEFERYSLPVAECKLSEILELAWDPQMQDWDLTNASSSVLSKVVSLLASQALSDDESFSAMCLAVASYDDHLSGGEASLALWSLIRERLELRPNLYLSIIWYWAQPVVRGEESFPVSAAMAEVWQRVSKQIRASRCADAQPFNQEDVDL